MTKNSVPKLVNGRGTLPIDRRFGEVGGVHVGRIRVASGTTDPQRWLRYQELMDNLVELGRGDILADLGNRTRTFEAVLRLAKQQKLNTVPNVANGNADVLNSLMSWLELGIKRNGEPYRPSALKAYRNNVTQMLKHAHGGEAVRDLPRILKAYRDWCVHPNRRFFTPFNQAKTVCLAFVRATQPDKQFSDLYREIAKIDALSTKRKRERNAISLWELHKLIGEMASLQSFVLWDIALTGLRFPSEYKGEWTVESDRVVIRGYKTKNAKRFVPLIDGSIKNQGCAESTLRRQLTRVSKGTITPYDLRGTYRRLLSIAVIAGFIETTRAKFYFGHEASLESNYEMMDFSQYLQSDADALRSIVDEQLSQKPSKLAWADIEDVIDED